MWGVRGIPRPRVTEPARNLNDPGAVAAPMRGTNVVASSFVPQGDVRDS
jgi:hypothetical protein